MSISAPVISVRALTYRYPPLLRGCELQPVLRGIDLEVAAGEFLALMGPTGVGKTTLCLALNGIVPQSTGGVIGGSVTVFGHEARRTPVHHLARHVGIVYQDPESQLYSATVEAEVAFGPENLAVPPQEIAERVAWALDVVGMSAYRQRAPAHLSGGQKQRVAIAAALAMLPPLLILDEPTAALDPLGRQEVFRVIEQLRQDRRMTIVMVSQDAEHVAAYADRLAVMVDGRIARDGPPEALFQDADLMQAAGIAPPQMIELSRVLQCRFPALPSFATLNAGERVLRAALEARP